MSRIRTIKPAFWSHEVLSAIPAETHMLAAALLNYADDEGYFSANPGLVRAATLPLRLTTDQQVIDAMQALAAPSVGFIRLGVAPDGRRYGHIVTFLEHQAVNRPTPSRIKTLPIEWGVSPHNTAPRAVAGALTEPSLPEGNGREGNGRETRAPEPVTALRRGDPHGMRTDRNAVAIVIWGPSETRQRFTIPAPWFERVRGQHGLDYPDADAFATWLGPVVTAAGGVQLPKGGNLFAYLDAQLAAWLDTRRTAARVTSAADRTDDLLARIKREQQQALADRGGVA